MQTLLARKSVSMTELREPSKILNAADNQPIAVMNRNQVVGYFVPVGAINPTAPQVASRANVLKVLEQRRSNIAPTLKYLEDK